MNKHKHDMFNRNMSEEISVTCYIILFLYCVVIEVKKTFILFYI